MSAKAHHRIPALDGVRGIAILAVLLHHSFHIKLLWLGVDIFFVLSGFLITQVLLRRRETAFPSYIGQFYLRRVQRILPAYLLCLVVALVLFGTFWAKYWYFYIGGMNFLPPFNYPYVVALPLWSLAVEEQFYLLWPLAIFRLDRRRMVQVSIALMLLAPVLRYVGTPWFHNSWGIYMLLPFRMDCMAAGGLLAFLWPEIKTRIDASAATRKRLQSGAVALGVIAIGAVLLLSHFGVSTFSNTPFGNLAIYEATLGISFALVSVALLGCVPQFFAWPPLTWLATISYSIYLFHLMFLFKLQTRFGEVKGAIAGIVLSLLFATASWFLLEKPILNLGKRDDRAITAQVTQS